MAILNAKQMKIDLYSYLTTDTTLAGLIVKNLYQNVAPKNAVPPYIVYHEISGDESTLHDGPCLADSRIQFDCYGNDTNSVEDVALALYSRLAHPGRFKYGETDFQNVSRTSPGNSLFNDSTETDGGIGIFGKSIDYLIGWAPLNQNQ